MRSRTAWWLAVIAAAVLMGRCATEGGEAPTLLDPAQAPKWSADDLEFYLHGSIGDEWVPERVLRAFAGANPDLFPGGDLRAYGVIGEMLGSPPVGFSRREVKHLGCLPSWGINCAACHTGQLEDASGKPLGLVLSLPGTFDVGGYFGAIIVSMLRATKPEGMQKLLGAFVGGEYATAALRMEADAIAKTVADDPFATKGIAAGTLHDITPEELSSPKDLAAFAHSLLKLFHNMRVALHVPDDLPEDTGTAPGPGRADAFVGLANGLLGIPRQSESASKFGVPWSLDDHAWYDWDGNSQDALSAHVAAALSSGCPMTGDGALVPMDNIKRFRALTETIQPPKWPFGVHAEAAKRGEKTYAAQCAKCHDVEGEERLFAPEVVGTDPNRARMFDQAMVDGLDKWLGSLKVQGFEFKKGGLRATNKYVANRLDGVWARAPYLHNGSVRTMRELLTEPAKRAKTWKRGSRVYAPYEMGFTDKGGFVFDTAVSGNSNAGHDYGTGLTDEEKRDLIEYLTGR